MPYHPQEDGGKCLGDVATGEVDGDHGGGGSPGHGDDGDKGGRCAFRSVQRRFV